MSRISEQISNMTARFDLKRVAGCGCLGCLLPILFGAVLVTIVLWWLLWSDGQQATAPRRYPSDGTATNSAYAGPVSSGTRRTMSATPVYEKTNAQGGIRHPELPSMMGNQPLSPEYNYLVKGPAEYKPYTGDNSLAQKSLYLAQANWSGQRRTPYVKGQVLSNGMTVVTADFDFVLLQDASGSQWACDPSGNNCEFWR